MWNSLETSNLWNTQSSPSGTNICATKSQRSHFFLFLYLMWPLTGTILYQHDYIIYLSLWCRHTISSINNRMNVQMYTTCLYIMLMPELTLLHTEKPTNMPPEGYNSHHKLCHVHFYLPRSMLPTSCNLTLIMPHKSHLNIFFKFVSSIFLIL